MTSSMSEGSLLMACGRLPKDGLAEAASDSLFVFTERFRHRKWPVEGLQASSAAEGRQKPFSQARQGLAI